jgi:hypothetical protein
MSQSSTSSAARPPQRMTGKEVHDFYVQLRHYPSGNFGLQCDAVRRGSASTVDVDQTEKNFVNHNYAQHWSTPLTFPAGNYRVRVPATLLVYCACCASHSFSYHSEEQHNLDVPDFFRDRYRNQAGTHLYLDARFNSLQMVDGQWGGNKYEQQDRPARHYQVSGIQSIANIYPCFKPGDGNQNVQKVLGVCYRRRDDNNQVVRTFGRSELNKQNSMAFDITDDFVRPVPDGQQTPDCHYKSVVSKSPILTDSATAIYVCRGARLVVFDERFIGAGKDHCRSLYQQGGLVVVRGGFMIGFNASFSMDSKNKIAVWKNVSWKILCTKYLVPPKDKALHVKDRTGNADISNYHLLINKVIFIGAAESKCNSVCYQLKVKHKDKNVPKGGSDLCHSVLEMPEGGVIMDIASWHHGMELVYWRHRYERLFESVLTWTLPAPPVPAVTLEDVTEIPPEEYIIHRILGIGAQSQVWCPSAIDYMVLNEELGIKKVKATFPSDDLDIRRFIPAHRQIKSDIHLQYLERPTEVLGNGLPSVPPLYPTFRYEGRLHYFTEGQIPVKTAANDFRVGNDGFIYDFLIRENVPMPSWVVWSADKQNDWVSAGDESQCIRLGMDYRKYVKCPTHPAKKMTIVYLNKRPAI